MITTTIPKDLVHEYIPSRNLHSKSTSLLVTSTPVTKSHWALSFQVAAAELWNGLPESVSSHGWTIQKPP